MSLLSFHLAHSPPYITPGFTPVHQWERDASNRNTCNYPRACLLKMIGQCAPRSNVLATAHAGSAATTACTLPLFVNRSSGHLPPGIPVPDKPHVRCSLGTYGSTETNSDVHSVSKVSNFCTGLGLFLKLCVAVPALDAALSVPSPPLIPLAITSKFLLGSLK